MYTVVIHHSSAQCSISTVSSVVVGVVVDIWQAAGHWLAYLPLLDVLHCIPEPSRWLLGLVVELVDGHRLAGSHFRRRCKLWWSSHPLVMCTRTDLRQPGFLDRGFRRSLGSLSPLRWFGFQFHNCKIFKLKAIVRRYIIGKCSVYIFVLYLNL